MQWAIDGVRLGAGPFVQKLETMGFDAQVAGIEFSDEVRTKTDVGPVAAFDAWLGGLTALGGGDVPSSALDVLMQIRNFTFRREATRYVFLLTRGGLHERGDTTNCSSTSFEEGSHAMQFTTFLSALYVSDPAALAGIAPAALTQAVGGQVLPLDASLATRFNLGLDAPGAADVFADAYTLTVAPDALPSSFFSGGIDCTIDGNSEHISFWITP